jgi:hypothetical protein|tara:strand:+ start:211 stop:945 length:735 start_codon:yes stop_codon:yes gene_type:complete
MKKLLNSIVLVAALFVFKVSLGQVSTHLYLNVSNENRAEFERLEMDYWSKVAKKGIDEGKMNGWGLLRTVGIDNVTHVVVNTFDSVEQAVNSSSIWNPSVIGMDTKDINTEGLRETLAVVQYQNEVSISGSGAKFTVHNYGNPKDVSAFVKENKTLWKNIHQKMKNTTKLVNWGVHTRIHPQGNSAYSSIWTRDGFKTLEDAMNYLRYKENNPYQSMSKSSNMNEIMPQGFKKTIIRETLLWVN